MTDVDLNIKVGTTPKDPLDKVDVKLKQVDKDAESLVSTFKGIGLAIGGIGAASAAFDFVLDATREMEDLTTQFIAFTGSAEGAAEQLEKLSQFAASSPFQLGEIAEANRTLLAFGFTTDGSIEKLRQLGEVSAATGTDLGDLARIFGQVQAEGKLTGERFNQLIERGVNIGPELAKSLGVASTSIKGLIADSAISAEEVQKAFQKMTSAGGQFFGSTERLSKTVSGSLSTLSDNFTILASTIGSSAIPAFSDLVGLISRATEGNIAYLKEQKKIANENEAQKRIRSIGEELTTLNEKLEDVKKNQGKFSFFGDDQLTIAAEIDALTTSVRTLSQERLKLVKQEGIAESFKKDAESAKVAQKQLDDANDLKRAKAKEAADALALEQQKAAEKELKELQDKEKKITETAFLEAAVRNEILKEQAGAQNEERIARLQEREAELTAVRMQTEADRLEQLKQFDAAELTRDQDRVNKQIQIEKQAEAKKLADLKKANADKTAYEIKAEQDYQKFLDSNYQRRADSARVGIAAIASLQKTGNRDAFNIGKRAAQAQVLLDTPKAAMAAYTSLVGIPYVGPVLAAVAAAAAVAEGAGRLKQIESQTFGYAEGGRIPGIGNRDTVPILATPGETIVPEKNFDDLMAGNYSGDNLILLQQGNEISGKILDVLTIGSVGEKLTQIVSLMNTFVAKIDAIGSGNGDGGFPVTPAEEPQTTGAGRFRPSRSVEDRTTTTRDSRGQQIRVRTASEA